MHPLIRPFCSFLLYFYTALFALAFFLISQGIHAYIFQSVFFYLLFTVLQFLCDCWIVLVCAVPRLLTLPNLLDP